MDKMSDEVGKILHLNAGDFEIIGWTPAGSFTNFDGFWIRRQGSRPGDDLFVSAENVYKHLYSPNEIRAVEDARGPKHDTR